jgi:regulator of protease activity HflC (stomatin/prohibitin superfamily)
MVVFWVIVGFLAFFLLCVVLPTSLFTVQQQTAAVIERFGKFKRVAGPGIHMKAPLGIDSIVARPTLRIQQLDLKMESKTKDDVTVELQLAIQFVIPSLDKVFDAHYKLVQPSKQMDAWVFDSVRSKVPFMQLNEVYENKDEIAKEVEERLKERMHLYGFEIVRALVNDVIPPDKVKSAMNEVNTQQRLQSAAYAEGEKNKIIIVKKAEAEAESKRLQGEGIANQRKAIVKGYKESIQDFVKGIPVSSAREVMDMVVVTQYFDTLERLGTDARSKVIFLPSTPGAVGDFMNQIRTAFASGLEAEAVGAPSGLGETTESPRQQVRIVSREK